MKFGVGQVKVGVGQVKVGVGQVKVGVGQVVGWLVGWSRASGWLE